jgi:protein arginine N-methyltransferase 1
MYSIYSYGRMLANTPRLHAYVAALTETVTSDSVVLDLGCGPGYFALLAAQLGARRVYAIEPDPVIQFARDAASANGLSARIEFFECLSTEVTLSEKANIVVSDLRGVLPFYQQNLPSIIDARNRLLAPGGVLIPKRDLLWAAVVEAPDRYQDIVAPWQESNFDLSAARTAATNTWRKAHLKPDQLLVSPVCWATLNYYELGSLDCKAEISWPAERSGTAHGFCVWFDSELVGNIGFSNHPKESELIYGNGLFPFPHPVEVAKGDRIELQLNADFIRDDYVWRWNTTILDGESQQKKAGFKQSTLYGVALSPGKLHKQAATYKPSLNQKGQTKSFILQLMTGDHSLEEIATRVAERFPKQYSDWRDALSDVTTLSQELSQ